MATATTHGARDHARAQAGTTVETMPRVPAPAGLTWSETVAGGNYTHRALARGTGLTLTDPAGDACAHLLLFATGRPWERLNVADTVKVLWNAYPGTGHLLLSDQGRVLASITASAAPADTMCGTSTLLRNTARYGDGSPQGHAPAGRELFKLAAAKHGLEPRDLGPSISFFQGVRVDPGTGRLEFTGSAGPGASVTLRAEMPLTVLVANTAHPIDPREDYVCTALEVEAAPGAPTAPGDPLWTATPEGERAFLNTADDLAARGIQ
ncbi:urea amidolyase associated protein UAAP1 [Actinocorallia longicatena]|uniref:Urea carboxylase-associated family protein n=1 Tax=Actinocorallia longicatena TaxID=111803 RepID=A0ABP6QCF0_9ACTN